MRLIDADKLMEELGKCFYDTANPAARRAAHDTMALCQSLVDEQPTAYDVEKVIEWLEHDTEIALKRYMNCNADTLPVIYTRYSTQYKERRKCLEIFKSGGIT